MGLSRNWKGSVTMKILAIDPGNIESAYVLMDENYKPLEFGKIPNEDMLKMSYRCDYETAVIEMIASYGMPVGKEVFETCVWIGRFHEKASQDTDGREIKYIYRKDVKMNLCGQTRAKDSNIRMALIDRFAQHDFKNGKGTKKDPDWFYGFKSDIWAAYAVGVTYYDTEVFHE